jgi:hypothetical protein
VYFLHLLYTVLAAPQKDHWSFFTRTGFLQCCLCLPPPCHHLCHLSSLPVICSCTLLPSDSAMLPLSLSLGTIGFVYSLLHLRMPLVRVLVACLVDVLANALASCSLSSYLMPSASLPSSLGIVIRKADQEAKVSKCSCSQPVFFPIKPLS